jgi:hypothetical protein
MNEANTWLYLVITGMRTIKLVFVMPLLFPIISFPYTTYNLTTMNTNSSFYISKTFVRCWAVLAKGQLSVMNAFFAYISKTFVCKMFKCACQMSTLGLCTVNTFFAYISKTFVSKMMKRAYQMSTLCPWSRGCFLSELIGCSTPSCPTAATSRGTTAGKGWSPKSKT